MTTNDPTSGEIEAWLDSLELRREDMRIPTAEDRARFARWFPETERD